MAKGIKMRKALLRNGKVLSRVSINELSTENNRNIFCEYCRVNIEYNSGYTLQATGTQVVPYLKLAKGEFHLDGCSNSISGAVKTFVASSSDIEYIPDIFEELTNGSFIFRMNLLQQTQRELSEKLYLIEKEGNTDKVGREYVKTQQRLASYLKSAAGVAKIRSLIQDNSDIPEFERLIKIQYKNSHILWNDFFYDDERYHVLFNRASKGKVNHPVAVRLTAKRESKSKSVKFPLSIQCYSEGRDNNFYIPWFSVHKDLRSKLVQFNKSYIVLSDIKVSSGKEDNAKYKNINLSISNRNQIVEE